MPVLSSTLYGIALLQTHSAHGSERLITLEIQIVFHKIHELSLRLLKLYAFNISHPESNLTSVIVISLEEIYCFVPRDFREN